MATDKYPQQNVNMPMSKTRVAAARARLDPGRVGPPMQALPTDGKGSRREIRPGEWIDDRKIQIGGPSSKSSDLPPEPPKKNAKAVPSSFDPNKVYSVNLFKPVMYSGRMLTPGKDYQMAGYVCTEITASIINAVELGAVPVDPDSAPS